MNPGYSPGVRSGTSFDTMSWPRSHWLDLDDGNAQSDLTYAPQPIIIDKRIGESYLVWFEAIWR